MNIVSKKYVAIILSILITLTLYPTVSFGIDNVVQDEVNGSFTVSVLQGEKWINAGSLDFGRFYREKQIDIGEFIKSTGELEIRITKIGGGSSHIDAVLLEDVAPVMVNQEKGKTLTKVLKPDFDVININEEEGLVFTFNSKNEDSILKVFGRIEKEVISKVPFTFPVKSEEFYSYTLDSNKKTPDNILNDLQKGEPFLKEFCLPGSGHPQGYIYGWVANDDDNLYVALDVTSDNTLDGDKDYAKVNIGSKVFEIKQSDLTWGKTSFVYTDKVEYEHKIYEFIIPLDEVNAENNSIPMSFTVYGTMSDPIVVNNGEDEIYVTEGKDEDIYARIDLVREGTTSGDGYPGDVTVSYYTEDDTATAGVDYTAASDSITFTTGLVGNMISIKILEDDVVEPDESFKVYITTSYPQYTLTFDTTTVEIIIKDAEEEEEEEDDDDEEYTPPTFSFSSSDYTVDESDEYAEITIEYDNGESEEIPVFMISSDNGVIGFSTEDDTAEEGVDYLAVSEILDFNGENEATVNIPIIPDDLEEGNEKVTLRLYPVYYRSASNEEFDTATLTIIDDDETIIPPDDPPVDPPDDPDPQPKPEREPKPKPPTGEVIIRKPDYIEIGKPVEKYPLNKDEVTINYTQKLLDENSGDVPVVCYWNTKYDKWVAITTYKFEEGKVKAFLDGMYKGWFKVYANGQPTFMDIDDAINENLYIRLNNLGILEGFVFNDFNFRVALVDQDISRNEFATFVYRMVNIDDDNEIIPILTDNEVEKVLGERFIDSSVILPWNRLITANLAAKDIVEAIDGSFKGAQAITTLEAAKMVNNAIKLLPNYKKINFDKFMDDTAVADWAKVALEDEALKEYIEANIGLDNTITREDALVTLYKLFIINLGW